MTCNSFSRSDRIGSARDFEAVKDNGVCVRIGQLVVCVLPAKKQRIGIIVTRHVGGAVERNRIRRVVREFFRTKRDGFPSGDCVVIARGPAKDLPNEKIRDQLSRALAKLGSKLTANE